MPWMLLEAIAKAVLFVENHVSDDELFYLTATWILHASHESLSNSVTNGENYYLCFTVKDTG